MKDIRGNLPLSAYHAITSKRVREIRRSHKVCLLGGDRCPPAINSHTVPLAALNRIEDRGHVYTFSSPRHAELESIYNGGPYRPSRCGVNEASAYWGFCAHHDNELFRQVEDCAIEPTARQVLLLHFRAYSRSFYSNINAGAALQAIANARRPDGHNPAEALSLVTSYEQRQKEAFSDLSRDYKKLLSEVESKSPSALRYCFLRLGCVPDLMCSSLLVPIFDIDGRFLLPQATETEPQSCQVASITISADCRGGFVLLAWTGGEPLTDAFADAFAGSRYDLSRLIAVIVGTADNFFFKREWWENLDEEPQAFLMYCASVAFLDAADPSRDHRPRMHRAISNRRSAYVEWPIVSARYGDTASVSGRQG